jgi:hypothetical protein
LQAFSTAQIAAMNSTHFASLLTLQVSALTSAQIAAIETADLAGFTGTQVAAIEARDIVGMSTAQLATLHPLVASFTDAQKNAMTTAQTSAVTTTPLVLDLNDDGIHTTSLNAGVQFDILDTGSRIPTGWVGANDGLLVRDLNGDGLINSGAELFGSSTVLPDGTRAQDGFQALGALDSDNNGVIDGFDRVFGELRVWQDVNQDGVSQSDELHTLDDLSIKSISLGFTPVSQDDAGNWIGLESTYQTTDEEIHKLVDVWFKLS